MCGDTTILTIRMKRYKYSAVSSHTTPQKNDERSQSRFGNLIIGALIMKIDLAQKITSLRYNLKAAVFQTRGQQLRTIAKSDFQRHSD